jgi:hypothetical protein
LKGEPLSLDGAEPAELHQPEPMGQEGSGSGRDFGDLKAQESNGHAGSVVSGFDADHLGLAQDLEPPVPALVGRHFKGKVQGLACLEARPRPHVGPLVADIASAAVHDDEWDCRWTGSLVRPRLDPHGKG